MAENPDSPVFAERYRFEPVGNDWDRGRSGFTHPMYDLKEKRLGVIKRAEIISKRLTEGLKNEVRALETLKGLSVPKVYDTGRATYGSKIYDYMVIEYIDGIRVEKNLDSLSIVERAEIISQLFSLLSQAHQQGIVNGDVDLKHLFWRTDKKQLVVIDWGNTRLGVDPKKKPQFAYDLARAAEIIFSLVTRQGHPSATGSIALPDASELVAGLEILPVEFQKLCKWAPRTPDGMQAPYTARELFEVSKRWLKAVSSSKPYKPYPLALRRPWLVGIPFLGIVCFALLATFKFFLPPSTSVTPTLTFTETSTPFPPTNAPILTETTSPIITPTETPTPLPSPLEYPSSIIVFDNKYLVPEFKQCWKNEIDPPSDLLKPEGFDRQTDGPWWVFITGDKRTAEESVKADFGTCPNGQSVNAMALNTWITQIQPENGTVPGGEFGLFLKGTNGITREYTLWVDQSERLHLRIRETDKKEIDDTVLVVNIRSSGRGNIYRQFRIQIFLEMDNNGSAILYLSEADSAPVDAQGIDPKQMIPINVAVLPTLGNLEEFGLVGRGGLTHVLIWPMVLLRK